MQKQWEQILMRWLDDLRGEEFEWGRTDCASIVVGVVQAAYGESKFDTEPPESLSEASEMYKQGVTPSSALKRLGAETEENLSFARRGDILITDMDEFDFEAAGVVLDTNTVLMSNSKFGVKKVPMSAVNEDAYLLRLPETVE